MKKDKVKITFEDLLSKVSSYIKDEEAIAEIKKAYEYASNIHDGDYRLTNEPYITHPVNVAYILAEIEADKDTIAAALLHDVITKGDATIEDLKENFREDIVTLVNGVTTINKLKFNYENDSMNANYKKIIVGLSEDVRILIIKFADRLHNMRTLWVLDEEKQKRKAYETLELLTPIADRLGMNQIKSELEDLSLRYYKPDVYFSIVDQLNQTKVERDNCVKEMITKVGELLDKYNIKHKIIGRAKSIYSIYKKLDKGKRFNDIYDLLALRIFVDTEQDCYQTLGIIHSKYRPIPKRFKDYVAMPKTNMYQSLHTTVFGENGFLFEIQIRTYEMDEIAENGIAAHWSYKENGSVKANLQNAMEQKLQFFKEIIELNNSNVDEKDYINNVKEDVFKDTIYVFTPKGDVVELPSGSTPIDFAYRIHSGVGDTMVGAIVNNNIVPLNYVLKDNDIVKINTNKNSAGPSREWIDMAYTQQAKNKVRAFFNKIDKDEYVKKGNDLLAKELKKNKIAINDFYDNDNIKELLEFFKEADINELYIDIGNNKITPKQVINAMNQNNKSKEEIILDRVINANVKQEVHKNDILVANVDEIKVKLASCCKPIPGDKIIGYITKGNGINVHRAICPNVADLDERVIDVDWNSIKDKKYSAEIMVSALNEKDILLNIISKTSNNNISILSVNTLKQNKCYMFDLIVSVNNLESLNKFILDIETIKDIIKVERIIK